MGFLALLASLAGCDQKASSSDSVAGLTRKENPPPKPPDCPQSDEIANVTLPNGQIADVRIIVVDGTKLYVPSPWISEYFVEDYHHENIGFVGDHILKRFIPDINRSECPGVIHRFNNKSEPGFGIGFRDGRRQRNGHRDGAELVNVAPGAKISGAEVQSLINRDGVRARGAMVGSSGPERLWLQPTPDIFVAYSLPNEEDRRKLRQAIEQDIRAMVAWMQEPPLRRDNYREFALGGDRS